MPKIWATPVRRPIAASWPMVLKRNGAALARGSRRGCCARAPCPADARAARSADGTRRSPDPGTRRSRRAPTRRASREPARCSSTHDAALLGLHGSVRDERVRRVPAVQTSVAASITVPSERLDAGAPSRRRPWSRGGSRRRARRACAARSGRASRTARAGSPRPGGRGRCAHARASGAGRTRSASWMKSFTPATVSTPAKPAAGDDEGHGGGRGSGASTRSRPPRAVDHPVAQRDGVAQRLHRERALREARASRRSSSSSRARGPGGRTASSWVCSSRRARRPPSSRARSISRRRRGRTAASEKSLRTGFTMWVMSRSLAATSCSIGVKTKKLSWLTSVTSTSQVAEEPCRARERYRDPRSRRRRSRPSCGEHQPCPSDAGRGRRFQAPEGVRTSGTGRSGRRPRSPGRPAPTPPWPTRA